MRLLRLVSPRALVLLALAFAACGDSNNSPPGSSQAGTPTEPTSLNLTDFRDCVDTRSGPGVEVVLTQGETNETRYGDELDASAPENVVR